VKSEIKVEEVSSTDLEIDCLVERDLKYTDINSMLSPPAYDFTKKVKRQSKNQRK